MKKIAAVICEYNPFHNGHSKQLHAIREALGNEVLLLSIMSGNYVQRGEAAIFPKYLRAKAAILGGSDLVLELPYPWSASPAERFAAAGVHIAAQVGASCICFGCESPIETLSEAAAFDFTPTDHPAHDPSSFARVREAAFAEKTGHPFPCGANDRLAIEYIRAITKEQQADPSVLPDGYLAFAREEDGFSAHRARTAIWENHADLLAALVPPKVRDCYTGISAARMENSYPMLLGRLRTAEPAELSALFDIPTELAIRFCRTAAQTEETDFDGFFRSLSSKNDSNARIRRGLLTTLLCPMPSDLAILPSYTTLLGAGKAGQQFLRQYSKNARFPILTKQADAPSGSQTTLTRRADLLYGLFTKEIHSLSAILAEIPYLEK